MSQHDEIKRATTLDDYIEHLLENGKHSQSIEFAQLIRIYGRDKIVEKALAAKKRIKEKRGW